MVRHFYVYVYVCMYGVYIDMQPHLHLWDREAANAFITQSTQLSKNTSRFKNNLTSSCPHTQAQVKAVCPSRFS